MSDKDDMFTPDEELGDLKDSFFDDDTSEKPKGKVKLPPSAQEKAKEMGTKSGDEAPKSPAEPEPESEPRASETPEAPVEPNPESKAPDAKKKKNKPTVRRRAKKPLTQKQKAINNMKRKAGMEPDAELPTIEHLLRCKQGTRVKISDIAVFISKPENEILVDLFKKMGIQNRVNLSTCVDLNRVKVVGGQILSAGRMYQPIQVAKIEEDGRLECTSGRHRMVFLALLYGPDAEIPVYIEDMALNEARDAVVVANMARKAKAREKADHAALASVGGDVDAEQDELYANMATTKAKVAKYCTFSVLERSRPMKLKFDLGTRKQGCLASITIMEGFWSRALDWQKEMSRKEFDAGLKASIQFANKLAEMFEANPSFEASQHMASMTMKAIGKYYRTMLDAGTEIDDAFVKKVTDVVVAMGAIGRQSSDVTYTALVKAMNK